jgi:dCMP deaminase
LRPTFEENGIAIAYVASTRSEDPYVKVGCVAFDAQNHVIATGYNGVRPGIKVLESFWNAREARLKFMIHAESNCLDRCKEPATMLCVTMIPCEACASRIAAHPSLKKVVYHEEYHRGSAAAEILKFHGIDLIKVDSIYIREIKEACERMIKHETILAETHESTRDEQDLQKDERG